VQFDMSVPVRCSPGELYAVLADIQDCAAGPGSPVRAMEKVPPGPTRVGTRWREVVRVGPGPAMTMWSEVTDVVPGRLLAMRFWGGSMEGDLTYTLTVQDGHTVLRQQETMHAVGWLRPLDRPLGRALGTRLARRLRGIAAMFSDGPAA
jgi:hypothetical protein